MPQNKKLNDSDLLELHKEGLMNVEIAEIMGVSTTTASRRTKELGLQKNKQHKRTAKVFSVYDKNGEYIMEGTVREIKARFRVSRNTIYFWAYCTNNGRSSRYEVHEVEV